jgi:hypothetical protein
VLEERLVMVVVLVLLVLAPMVLAALVVCHPVTLTECLVALVLAGLAQLPTLLRTLAVALAVTLMEAPVAFALLFKEPHIQQVLQPFLLVKHSSLLLVLAHGLFQQV